MDTLDRKKREIGVVHLDKFDHINRLITLSMITLSSEKFESLKVENIFLMQQQKFESLKVQNIFLLHLFDATMAGSVEAHTHGSSTNILSISKKPKH